MHCVCHGVMSCSIEAQAALQGELAEMTLQLDLMKEEHEKVVAEVRPLHCPAGLTALAALVSPQLQDRHEVEKEHISQRHEAEIRCRPHAVHHVMCHVTCLVIT